MGAFPATPYLPPLLIQCIFVTTCIFGADLTKVLATDGRSLMVREVSCVDINIYIYYDKVLIHQIQTEDALNRTCAHGSIEGESMSILKYKTCSFCPRSQDPTVDLKSRHYHLHALCV